MAFSTATLSSILRESMGSTTLHIATFAAGGSLSWASGLPNAVAWWANCGSGQGAGVTTSYAASSGVTFYLTGAGAGNASNDIYNLFVLSRT